MNVIENKELRRKLFSAFPKGFINSNLEFIAHPARNSYFILDGVETEEALQAKVLEWLSRESIKGGSKQSQKYHLDGINKFLGTDFTPEEMEQIYTRLGNSVNHGRTISFIETGYKLAILAEQS